MTSMVLADRMCYDYTLHNSEDRYSNLATLRGNGSAQSPQPHYSSPGFQQLMCDHRRNSPRVCLQQATVDTLYAILAF